MRRWPGAWPAAHCPEGLFIHEAGRCLSVAAHELAAEDGAGWRTKAQLLLRMGPALLRARVDRRAEANTLCFLSRARSAPVLSCSFWTSPGWPRRFAARERRFPEGLPPSKERAVLTLSCCFALVAKSRRLDLMLRGGSPADPVVPRSCARSLCDFVPPQLHLLAVARVLAFVPKRRFSFGRSGD
jgi:hypothetical protein